MNNIDIANGVVFQNLKLSKDTFNERLISQKKIYLLQSLGTDLGYTYNWYVRGPYSPSLTTYLYNNLDVLISNDFDNYKISNITQKNIKAVNDLDEEKRDDFTSVTWYELLASLLYIHNNRVSWKIDEQDGSLFETLIKYKPQYNKDQCDYAFKILKDKAFVNTE